MGSPARGLAGSPFVVAFSKSHVPLLSTQEAVDVRLTWTDSDEAGDYVVSNVLSPRDLVSRPDNMNEIVLHTHTHTHAHTHTHILVLTRSQRKIIVFIKNM